jgi:hypothetical protein
MTTTKDKTNTATQKPNKQKTNKDNSSSTSTKKLQQPFLQLIELHKNLYSWILVQMKNHRAAPLKGVSSKTV